MQNKIYREQTRLKSKEEVMKRTKSIALLLVIGIILLIAYRNRNAK